MAPDLWTLRKFPYHRVRSGGARAGFGPGNGWVRSRRFRTSKLIAVLDSGWGELCGRPGAQCASRYYHLTEMIGSMVGHEQELAEVCLVLPSRDLSHQINLRIQR